MKRVRAWSSNDSSSLFAVAAIAAFARFYRLGNPDGFVFDEVYYAKEACFYFKASETLCQWPEVPPAEVHPPLAKWLMGIGIQAAGFNSIGWRLMSAAVGVLGVVLLYLLARKLLRSTLGATVAAGLVALDPLHFVHSRTALLDIYPTTLGLAALLFLIYDRDRMSRARGERDRNELQEEPKLLARPWRLAAGIAAGAATASKWTGGLVLLAVIVISVVWEIGYRRDRGTRRALFESIKYELPSIVLYLGVVPLGVYVASYIGRLHGPVLEPFADGSWWREWWRYQSTALEFHRGVASHHGYESPPGTWIFLKRPLLYWAEEDPARKSSIYAIGNPLIWWPAIAAYAYLLWGWIRKKDGRDHRGFLLAGIAFTYLIWLVLAPNRDAVFLFYLLPAVPFLCLAVAAVIAIDLRGRVRTAAVAVTAVLSLGWFLAYYPIIANVEIPRSRWEAQMFFKDCDKPTRRELVTQTVTQAVNEATTIVDTGVRTETDATDLPPRGWCWT